MSRKDVLARHKERRFLTKTLNKDGSQVFRNYQGKFVKGASGNPKGMTKEFKQNCDEFRSRIIRMALDINLPGLLKEATLAGGIEDKRALTDRVIAIMPKETISDITHRDVTPQVDEKAVADIVEKYNTKGKVHKIA